MDGLTTNLVTLGATTLLALFGWLIRSVLNGLVKEIHEMKGALKPVSQDLRDNTKELIKIRTELDAVWRYVDAPGRKTDNTIGRSNHG